MGAEGLVYVAANLLAEPWAARCASSRGSARFRRELGRSYCGGSAN